MHIDKYEALTKDLNAWRDSLTRATINPHLERLVEASVFLAAKCQHSIERQENLSQRFFAACFGHYFQSMPSMLIAQSDEHAGPLNINEVCYKPLLVNDVINSFNQQQLKDGIRLELTFEKPTNHCFLYASAPLADQLMQSFYINDDITLTPATIHCLSDLALFRLREYACFRELFHFFKCEFSTCKHIMIDITFDKPIEEKHRFYLNCTPMVNMTRCVTEPMRGAIIPLLFDGWLVELESVTNISTRTPLSPQHYWLQQADRPYLHLCDVEADAAISCQIKSCVPDTVIAMLDSINTAQIIKKPSLPQPAACNGDQFFSSYLKAYLKQWDLNVLNDLCRSQGILSPLIDYQCEYQQSFSQGILYHQTLHHFTVKTDACKTLTYLLGKLVSDDIDRVRIHYE